MSDELLVSFLVTYMLLEPGASYLRWVRDVIVKVNEADACLGAYLRALGEKNT